MALFKYDKHTGIFNLLGRIVGMVGTIHQPTKRVALSYSARNISVQGYGHLFGRFLLVHVKLHPIGWLTDLRS